VNLDLSGRKVIVSGGSRGIGRAIVETFLEEGASVAFCARDAAGVSKAESELGGRAKGTALDVANAKALTDWVETSAANMGGLDIVVSNVSALSVGADRDVWHKTLDIDLLGAATMVSAALPSLRKSDAASVVLISSVSGVEYDIFGEPYGAMKAALIHYGKTLSVRHAPDKIRVNTVSPGNIYFSDGVWGSIERDNPELFAECLAMNPMGRMGRPDEIAKLTAFVASPAASFMTGANVLADGGLSRGVQY